MSHPPSAARSVIGLDVGGTKIAAGLVTFPGASVRARTIIATRAERGGEAVLADCLNVAAGILSEAQAANLSVASMGVCVCELVDLQGNITSDQTIKWRGVDLRARFSQLVPTVIEADIRAAALAEALYGAGRPFNLFVYLTVGTGISYGLVQAQKPFAGAHGSAMLIGNTPLCLAGDTPGSATETILEQIASGPALVQRYSRVTGQQFARAEQVIAAAENGEAAAVEIVQEGGRALGMGVGLLVNLLDPEAIIIGGGLGLSAGLYWQHMLQAARGSIWSDGSRDLPILQGALGTDAAVIGAAVAANELFNQ